MVAQTYYVKRDLSLFRKARWKVVIAGEVTISLGVLEDSEAAIALALAEAQRSAELGRASQVYADNGEGMVLVKAFEAVKAKGAKGQDIEEPEGAEEKEEDSGVRDSIDTALTYI
jgi:hypothetical protein